jgi:hypothetical protein
VEGLDIMVVLTTMKTLVTSKGYMQSKRSVIPSEVEGYSQLIIHDDKKIQAL